MLLKMYSIYDSKAGVFNNPFFKRSHGEAERDFQMVCQDPKTTPAQYPEDYDLYFVGEYDDNSGKITPLDTPQHLIKAVHFKGTN